MRAYHYDNADTGLELTTVPDPEPQYGEVLIAVEAAGLCLSDVHILNGHGEAWLRKKPIVLGHEVAGTVTRIGPGVDNVKVNDRVVVALVSHPIAQADFANAIGLGYDGGYATVTCVPAKNVVAIPDGVSFEHAAVATDSIATAYHAVVAEAGVTPGSSVAIIGLGGLGLSAVEIAALAGGTVFGIDIREETFDLALEQGATRCFTNLGEISEEIDVILDFAGTGTSTAQAVDAVKPGGRVVLVGLGAPASEIATHQLVTKNVQLRGSIGASIAELQAVLTLIAKEALNPIVSEVPFDDIEGSLRRLEAGGVSGRLYTKPTP